MAIGRREPEEKFLGDCEVLPQRWDMRFGLGRAVSQNGEIGQRSGGRMDFSAVESVRIKVLKLEVAAQLPRYAHVGPYGDLAADLYAVAGLILKAGETAAVATGVAMEFPATHGALVEDRS